MTAIFWVNYAGSGYEVYMYLILLAFVQAVKVCSMYSLQAAMGVYSIQKGCHVTKADDGFGRL